MTAMELIDPEETPKNVLIRGVKRENISNNKIAQLIDEYRAICNTLGIYPYLSDKYVYNQHSDISSDL